MGEKEGGRSEKEEERVEYLIKALPESSLFLTAVAKPGVLETLPQLLPLRSAVKDSSKIHLL